MPLAVSTTTQNPSSVDVSAFPAFSDSDLSGLDLEGGYCRQRGFAGKAGQSVVAPGANGATTVVVGLGDRARLDAEALRLASAAAVRAAWHSRRGAFRLPELLGPLSWAGAAQAVTEGAMLAAHVFGGYKSADDGCELESLEIWAPGADGEGLAAGARRGAAVARAVNLARDLVNEPAGAMTPRRLAEVATLLGEGAGLGIEVWDQDRIVEEGLGGLAGVAAGSDEPARLIKLSYQPAGVASPTVALVGKGITFDSGGLSLKTAEGMATMKTDMSGAASVIGTMSVLHELAVRLRVIGIIPTTENMPGGRATKPGDVLRTRNGKTIEVLNTDAEGRLVLADGLALAVEEAPDAIVDLATLTGACVGALGRRIAGLMGNNDGLITQVGAASARSGERTWPLPLPPEYRKHIDSEIADMRNIGEPGQAGALVAGLLLAEFVGEVPWVHLDIAGPARSSEEDGYLHKGGTGYGVRTLIELLEHFEPLR